MEITTVAARGLRAGQVKLGYEHPADEGLGYPHRALYVGPLVLVTTARNDDSAGWLEAAQGLEALIEAAEGMHRWALAQAEAADDLKAQRETVALNHVRPVAAQARRVADFGDVLRAAPSAPERDKHTGLGRDSMDSADPYSVAFAFGAGR